MSLTDIMSAMDLVIWPELALGLFLAAFIAIAFRTYGSRRRGTYDAAARLPLDDELPEQPQERGDHGKS
ncbi:MAG: cbb3-type cytochrome c oxidase subunit 3 [Deltaproteobacteria bacterium]|nr:cbb3-type cytochrome c oxidase subunit 3 [Deltaproteobacteria bacterium]